MYEARLTIETARKTGLSTHLLAWSKRPDYEQLKSGSGRPDWQTEGDP